MCRKLEKASFNLCQEQDCGNAEWGQKTEREKKKLAFPQSIISSREIAHEYICEYES